MGHDHDHHWTIVTNRDHDASEGDTRRISTHLDAAIAIRRWTLDEDEMVPHDHGLASTCDHDRPVNLKQIGWLAFVVEDFYAIAVRLPRDHGAIEPRSWLTLGAIVPRLPLSDGPRSSCDHGHHFHRIKRPQFSGENSL